MSLNHDTYTADGFDGPIAFTRELALRWFANRRMVQPRVHVYLNEGYEEVDVTGDFEDELEAEAEAEVV